MRKWVLFLCAVVIAQPVTAYADSSDQMMTLLESMKQQMTRMQQTIDQQSVRIQQLESSRVIETPQPNVPVQPGSATMSDADFQKSLKDNIGEAIPWMKGAKYGGDFRMRYEAFEYDDNNPAENVASDRTRNRFRIRLRWGFEKDYMDDWKVGFRLAGATSAANAATPGANGLATDNTSTNVTLGNPGYFVYKNIYIDRAYGIYEPNGLKDYGPFRGAKVGVGKFDNPFLRYSTTIVWDADVTPEGMYEQVNLNLLSSEENKLNLQGTAGQFIANENSGLESDANIFGYQGAVNWSTYNFGGDRPVDLNFAASFYDYTNWGQTIANNTVTSTSFLRTNTLIADDFRVLDLYPEMTFYVNNTPVVLWYDFAKNLGNVGTEDIIGSGGNNIHDTDTAWGLGLKVGKIKKRNNWEAFYGYYEIGANSVVAAFNDSDFGGPAGQGFTNRQGHKFGLGYALTDAITVNWTGYVVTPLNPNAAVANSINETVFRSQADLVYKF